MVNIAVSSVTMHQIGCMQSCFPELEYARVQIVLKIAGDLQLRMCLCETVFGLSFVLTLKPDWQSISCFASVTASWSSPHTMILCGLSDGGGFSSSPYSIYIGYIGYI